jgi:hypothetical protein
VGYFLCPREFILRLLELPSLLAGGGRDEAVPRQIAAGNLTPAGMRRATQIALNTPNCGRRATGNAGLLGSEVRELVSLKARLAEGREARHSQPEATERPDQHPGMGVPWVL